VSCRGIPRRRERRVVHRLSCGVGEALAVVPGPRHVVAPRWRGFPSAAARRFRRLARRTPDERMIAGFPPAWGRNSHHPKKNPPPSPTPIPPPPPKREDPPQEKKKKKTPPTDHPPAGPPPHGPKNRVIPKDPRAPPLAKTPATRHPEIVPPPPRRKRKEDYPTASPTGLPPRRLSFPRARFRAV